MWTQFVLRALAELPAIISTVEHNRALEGGGRGGQKLADVNEKMTKVEGDTSNNEATVAMRLQAIEALVGYANQLAAAERGLRPGRTSGGPANEPQPATPIVTPATPQTIETPDDRLAAEKARAEEAAKQGRLDAAKAISACFTFPPDAGQFDSFVNGHSLVGDFVKDMVDRNGGVVPENLPAPFKPVPTPPAA
jgi:hypothetical protein